MYPLRNCASKPRCVTARDEVLIVSTRTRISASSSINCRGNTGMLNEDELDFADLEGAIRLSNSTASNWATSIAAL